MAIRIDTSGANGTAIGTRVYNSDGAEIEGVERIDISLSANEFMTATIVVEVSKESNLDGLIAALDHDSLESLAKASGYELKPRQE